MYGRLCVSDVRRWWVRAGVDDNTEVGIFRGKGSGRRRLLEQRGLDWI